MRKLHLDDNPFGGRVYRADDPAPPVDPPVPPTIPPGGEEGDEDDGD